MMKIYTLAGLALGAGLLSVGTALAEPCEMRVLVAYTNGVAANPSYARSPLERPVEYGIKHTNEAFANSGINHRVSLARAVKIQYDPRLAGQTDEYKTAETIRNKFKAHSGAFSPIGGLMERYQADLAVLIVNRASGLGIASRWDIRLNGKMAKGHAVIKVGGALGKYSMAHELGHLYGAMHEFAEDNGSFPFAYGHGHVLEQKDKRGFNLHTIMAYGRKKNIAERDENLITEPISHFSDPNQTYNSEKLGKRSSNAVKVINDSYRATKNPNNVRDITVAQPETIHMHEAGNIIAKNLLSTTSGVPFIFETGSKGSFRALDGTIHLKPGFHAQAGSKFRAHIKNCQ